MHQERNRAGTRRSVGARHAKRRCPLQPGGHWPDSRPWMFRLDPRLNHALIGRGPHFTSEALLA
ncbi:hypothetical protein, partial [Raoultella planticola]|uniref:hypothetical protein n=1 Tax=Raoultella planticola TaxID=575 RepID=UPI003D09544B